MDAVRPPCKHEGIVDLTNGSKYHLPHFYCHRCDGHIYKGKEWTKEEWDAYVNDMSAPPDNLPKEPEYFVTN